MNNFIKYVEMREADSDSSGTDVEFLTKRKAGAKKIAAQAKEKGGPAMLTYWHFEAKDAQYAEAIEAVRANENKEYFVSKYKKALGKIQVSNFNQKEFQSLSGELEVWGEVLARLF